MLRSAVSDLGMLCLHRPLSLEKTSMLIGVNWTFICDSYDCSNLLSAGYRHNSII